MSKSITLALWVCIVLSSCFKEVGIPVTTDFIYTAKDSIFTVPANINFTNRTIGATHFKWTFEGGEPASSEYENPIKIKPFMSDDTNSYILLDVKV
jgi:hypothetical protein